METYIYNKRFARPVYRTVMPSGPQVFTAETPGDVFLKIIFPVGGYEDEIPGTAHYLEHMMLRGPHLGEVHPLFKDLLPRGASFTATTDFFWTRYLAQGASEDAYQILCALYRACTNPLFTIEQIDGERPVILEEGRLTAGNEDFRRWLVARQLPDHPRLQIRSMGYKEHIQQINEDALHTYFERHYQMSRIAFFCSGGISHQQHLDIVRELLGGITEQHPPSSGHRTFGWQPYSLGRVVSPESSARLDIQFRQPTDPTEKILFRVNQSLLDDPPLGILFRKLREERRLVYAVNLADSDPQYEDTTLWTTMAADHLDQVHDLVWESIDELVENRFSDDLFSMVKSRRKQSFEIQTIEHPRATLNYIEQMWLRDDYEDLDIRRIVLGATREQLAHVARKYFRRDCHGILKTTHQPTT